MPNFIAKKLAPPFRLGEKLRTSREEQGLSVETLSLQVSIPKEHIFSLEENNFNKLPRARVFRAAYLRSLASALNLKPDLVLKQFAEEGGWDDITTDHPAESFQNVRTRALSVLARNLAIAGFIFIFVFYLAWQIRGILTPPKLEVFSPLEGAVIKAQNVLVQGQTESETHLTINDQAVRPNDRGGFESPVDLSNGINVITISATKKHGKSTTVIRHIIANIPNIPINK
ncbi:helix-turn-helix domain-containing protein [Patescibacteria group bacterium]|nr:helix-turn-helix domain-containing protein [Patescibacteria group bacterium]MBU1613474.1 helix-turn-helix domain-containing protein [Patescibacteria group bacterium]